jgi:hypothetical protein
VGQPDYLYCLGMFKKLQGMTDQQLLLHHTPNPLDENSFPNFYVRPSGEILLDLDVNDQSL